MKYIRKEVYFILLEISIIFLISSLVISQSTKHVSPRYDPQIINELEKSDLVNVIVYIRDDSGIVVSGSKEEKRYLSNQRIFWLNNKSKEIFDGFSLEESKFLIRDTRGFSGKINRKLFEKLIFDTRIDSIYLNSNIYINN